MRRRRPSHGTSSKRLANKRVGTRMARRSPPGPFPSLLLSSITITIASGRDAAEFRRDCSDDDDDDVDDVDGDEAPEM